VISLRAREEEVARLRGMASTSRRATIRVLDDSGSVIQLHE
jgi:hypothetical protein